VQSVASSSSWMSATSLMGKVKTRMSIMEGEDNEEEEGTPKTEADTLKLKSATLNTIKISLSRLILLACIGLTSVSSAGMWLVYELLLFSKTEVSDGVVHARIAGAVMFVMSVILGVITSFALSSRILSPLSRVSRLMTMVGDPSQEKFIHQIGETPSAISEFSKLQKQALNMIQGVEVFMRYVPDTVVRNIFQGDETALRLHVARRKVTIMFSDVKDFTTIAEELKQEDLLFLLTRYLSVMTKIAETFKGVVAEIMGDGLLIFWNTPDDVLNHEAQACAAALAMQEALITLNDEFKRASLPSLGVRIGIHSGQVLTGNIGSQTKMKFGCIGDPMNLSSRLEGLNKVYGTSVICSDKTHKHLNQEAGFVCRELDFVQVKGKNIATRIYEVITLNDQHGFVRGSPLSMPWNTSAQLYLMQQAKPIAEEEESKSELGEDSPVEPSSPVGVREVVHLYEAALHSYQKTHFDTASGLLEKYLKILPTDKAANMLLERTKKAQTMTDAELLGWTGVFVLNDK